MSQAALETALAASATELTEEFNRANNSNIIDVTLIDENENEGSVKSQEKILDELQD